MPGVKDREPRQVGFGGFLPLSHSFLSLSSPLHSLFLPLTFSNSPAESQSLPGWVLFDIAVCVFFCTMLTHSHFLWEDSFCLDSEEQCRCRGVGFGGLVLFCLVSALRYLFTLIFL